MQNRYLPRTGALILALAAQPWVARAQSEAPSTGGHVHYVEPKVENPSPASALAPRLQNLGSHTFPVSTRNKDAQLFINQGLNLAYAFNHAEARRAFR